MSTLRVNHYADQFLSLQGLYLAFRIYTCFFRRIYERVRHLNIQKGEVCDFESSW